MIVDFLRIDRVQCMLYSNRFEIITRKIEFSRRRMKRTSDDGVDL